MPKCKTQNTNPEPETPTKRLTRSAASRTSPPLASVDINGSSPVKRSRRQEDSVDEEATTVTPTKRSRKQESKYCIASLPQAPECLLEATRDEEEDKPSGVRSQPEKDDSSPRKRKRRIVFDSVEISTPRTIRRATKSTSRAQSPSPTPSSRTRKPLTKESITQTQAISPDIEMHAVDIRDHRNPLLDLHEHGEYVEKLPLPLPTHLHQHLQIQKRLALRALRGVTSECTSAKDEEHHINFKTAQQLRDLLSGTIDRGEGNSCLIIGPAGSGKSKVRYEIMTSNHSLTKL